MIGALSSLTDFVPWKQRVHVPIRYTRLMTLLDQLSLAETLEVTPHVAHGTLTSLDVLNI
jgi:hypothetical protein